MLVTVTETAPNAGNINYIKQTLNQLIDQAGGEIRTLSNSNRALMKVDCPEYYGDIVRIEIIEKVAEIIAIKYKYDFFKKEIKIAGLNAEEKEILYASLISADLNEDKKYVFEKIKKYQNISIDGMFNFMLSPLKKKWQDIVSYMPACFLSGQLKDFITYLLIPKKSRVIIDDGRVYNDHYQRLIKSDLLDGEKVKITREVLLSNCGEIELTGSIPLEDEKYLKEYYADKIYFSRDIH